MDEKDQALVEQLVDRNARFRMLYEEHLLLEKELEQIDQKVFLTPEEEFDRKKVQKLKLAGRDEMERLLTQYRQ